MSKSNHSRGLYRPLICTLRQGVVKAIMDATCLNELLVNVKERVPNGFSQKFFQYQINKIGPLWYDTLFLSYFYERH